VDIVFANKPDSSVPMEGKWRREIDCIENKILFFEEIVRAFTQVVQDNLSFYWGTSRWSPMEIMVGQKLFRFTYILFDSPGSLFRCPTI
jgi:hypothetical protein